MSMKTSNEDCSRCNERKLGEFFASGECADTLIKTKSAQEAQRLHIDQSSRKPRGAYHQGSRQVHEENLPEVWEKEFGPSCSPDCNPVDYFVLGVSEFIGQCKVSQQNPVHDPQDEGGDGFP